MTASMPGVPPELKGLPQVVLEQLEAACAGDWRRVTADGGGSYTVHNHPQMRRVQLPPTQATKKHMNTIKAAAPRVIGRDREVFPDVDWRTVAKEAADAYRNGIPASVMVEMSDAVMNLPTTIVEKGLASVRTPIYVEIDERSSEERDYAILKFHRMGTGVLVGLRQPTSPYMMAIFAE